MTIAAVEPRALMEDADGPLVGAISDALMAGANRALLHAVADALAAGIPWGEIIGDLRDFPLPYKGEALTVGEVGDFRRRMGL